SPTEIIGHCDEELLSAPLAAELHLADITAAQEGGATTKDEQLGDHVYSCQRIPWRNGAGEFGGIIMILREHLERRHISTRQRNNSELLELAQEAAGVGVFEWQVQSGVLQLSPKFLSLYGLVDFDGRYDSWFKCMYREDMNRVVHDIDTVFANHGRDLRAEFRVLTANDNALKWMEARAIVFYDPEGRAKRVVGVNVDVTERKRAIAQMRAFTETLEERVKERTRELEAQNEARVKAEESLRQAQKMEAVGQLTGGVAHDFNNLLTVVMGGLNVIGKQIPALEASPAVARIERARDMAQQGVRRAAALTNRLLTFSRQQPLAPKAINANRLVSGVYELLRRTLGEAVSLETVLGTDLWATHTDSNQLENALVNLAVNARDAMPNGGKMTIATKNVYLDEAYIATLSESIATGEYVVIEVTDTGVGMDPLTLQRAFEPFFTTKDVGKGTGLGLSQVYGFVRQSLGHVRIESTEGVGTTVKIYLPRYLGQLENSEYADLSADAPRSIGDESILLAEDDEVLRKYIVETLTDLGYHVLHASDGPTALAIFIREDTINLLLTDVVMPGGMNGRQLANEARLRRPDLKVLLSSGYTRDAIVHQGRLDPGMEMIAKPYTLDELAVKIRFMLDSR
ncbi:MAG: response regulator, partial [Candidatus Obscuribacterales bacterium]|nr:response regulator [Steroidobacteraceae bacterium]